MKYLLNFLAATFQWTSYFVRCSWISIGRWTPATKDDCIRMKLDISNFCVHARLIKCLHMFVVAYWSLIFMFIFMFCFLLLRKLIMQWRLFVNNYYVFAHIFGAMFENKRQRSNLNITAGNCFHCQSKTENKTKDISKNRE